MHPLRQRGPVTCRSYCYLASHDLAKNSMLRDCPPPGHLLHDPWFDLAAIGLNFRHFTSGQIGFNNSQSGARRISRNRF